jgi:hypothetical protein
MVLLIAINELLNIGMPVLAAIILFWIFWKDIRTLFGLKKTKSKTANNGQRIGYVLFIGLAIVTYLVYIIISKLRKDNEKDLPKIEIPQQKKPQQTLINPEKTKRYFQFPKSGCFEVYLKQGWSTFPKGGKISIKTPNNRTYYDEPGVSNYLGYQPEGIYTFCRIAKSATGVEIENYW